MCLAFNRNLAYNFWPEVWVTCSLDLDYKCQVVRWMLAQSNTLLQFEGPLGLLTDFEGRILAVISPGFFFFSPQYHVFCCCSRGSLYVPFSAGVHVQLLSWHVIKLVLTTKQQWRNAVFKSVFLSKTKMEYNEEIWGTLGISASFQKDFWCLWL